MTMLHIKTASDTIIRMSMLNAQRSSDMPIDYDQKIWLTFAPDSGVLMLGD